MGKKLLILGASPFQVPAIIHGLKLGCQVITCDNRPDNPGHCYAHATYNISTVDELGILRLADTLAVDGILAFASDPAAKTAAFVQEQLGLPGNPYESVCVLSHKPTFRRWLRSHGFFVPQSYGERSWGGVVRRACDIGFPVVIKPSSSSGSKGVSRVLAFSDLAPAYQDALAYGADDEVVVEQYIQRDGPQIAGDGLVVEGKLVFEGFGNENFDPACKATAPVGESFPGDLDEGRRQILRQTLQRLFGLLKMRNLVFNLDAAFDRQGNLFLIDLGARAGGNFLPQVIHHHTGCDLTDIAIRLALGQPVSPDQYRNHPRGCHAIWVLHSAVAGRFGGVRLSPELGSQVLDCHVWAQPGQIVRPFQSSRDGLGCILLQFRDRDHMAACLENMNQLYAPLIEPLG